MRRDDYRAMVEQRNHCVMDAEELHQKAKAEQRSLTDDEQRRWNERMREAQRLGVEIEAARAEGTAPSPAGNTVEMRSPFAEGPVDREIEQAIRGISKGESRALATAVSISPGELSTTLFDRLRASSVVLKTGVKTLKIESDSAVYPRLISDVAPSWTSEAASIAASDPGFDTVTATPRKLAALTQTSNELLDDSDPPLTGVLQQHLMTVLGLKLDAGLLEGTGVAPEVTGLKNITNKQSLAAATNGAQPSFDIFADAIALLESVNVPRERMRIIVAPRNISTLRKAKASTAGSYLWGDPANAEPATVFGVPVVASAQLALNETQGTSGAVANSAYVFDTESVVFVWRSPIEVEIDRSRLFNSDQSEFRAKMRGDLISPTPTGIVRVTGLLA